MTLFVDTSALVALADRTDQFHRTAKSFVEGLPPAASFQTSNYVLDETITRLRSTLGVDAAVRTAESIWNSAWYTIQTVDQAIERRALTLMRKYAEHHLSFTDCTTLVFLERMRADQVFAFDHDFHRVGYLLVPGAS